MSQPHKILSPRPSQRARVRLGSGGGFGTTAAWWLTGWQRLWRKSPNDEAHEIRIYRKLLRAEDCYQRENQMGKYALLNHQPRPNMHTPELPHSFVLSSRGSVSVRKRLERAEIKVVSANRFGPAGKHLTYLEFKDAADREKAVDLIFKWQQDDAGMAAGTGE